MNSRNARNAGVQVLTNAVTSEADNMQNSMQQLKSIPEAYEKAPSYGRLAGALYGIPAGLLAGGTIYGVSSLIPWLRRQKRLKQILSLAAAAAGGWYIGKPTYEKARDLYFEQQTGIPSPWKTYKATPTGKTTFKPSEIIDSYKDAFAQAKDDPLGYFKTQMTKDIHANSKQSEIGAISDAYAKAWQQFKADPSAYLQSSLNNAKPQS